MKKFCFLFLMLATLSTGVPAQIAAGGNYTLEQAVIANGGGSSVAPNYNVDGTAGQPAAGIQSSNTPYSVRGGFWTGGPLAPTAAMVKISGLALRGKDIAIKDAVITLTGGNMTTPRIARSNGLGRFVFDDVEVGPFYVLTITHKSYGFAENVQAFVVMEDVENVIFRSNWEN